MQNVVEKNFLLPRNRLLGWKYWKNALTRYTIFQICNIKKKVSVLYLAIMKLLFQHNYTVVGVYTKGDYLQK